VKVISKHNFGNLPMHTLREAWLCTREGMLVQAAMMVAAKAQTIGTSGQCNPATNVWKNTSVNQCMKHEAK
jgi:hypothetical protein